MNKKQLNHIGVLILTIGGGGLIAITSVKRELQEQFPFLPPRFYQVCLVLGFLLTMLGLLLLLLPIDHARNLWRWFFGKTTFVPHAARREDLERIYRLGEDEFGEVSPLEKMKEWYNLNRNIFHVMQRVRIGKFRRSEELVGYYSVLPLKQAAISLLDSDIFDGTKITNDLIIKERKGRRLEEPACIYIGGIAARGSSYVKGRVVGELSGRLRTENDRGVTLIYSRPVTQRGLDLLLDQKFEPVNPPYKDPLKHIYKRDLSQE